MSTKFFTNKYDNLQRLKQAQFFSTVGTTTTANTHNETVNYDKNGNITTLQRTGYYVNPSNNASVWDEWLDNLTYTYQGNKLNNVSDAGNKTAGVLDPATGALDYNYDLNGNLTKDNNKGITTITYNHFNLPLTITFSASKSINFVYNAAGTKLSKKVTKGASETTTFYAGNYIYEKTTSSGPVTLKCFSQPEGYVDVTGSAFKYIYQYKDHLGNVRLSYTKTATGLQIVEENHYYPFGVKHNGYNNVVNATNTGQKFKFNAKEYETELDVTEMDFRQYDAGLGRFYGLDLLAEATPWATPNHFALNNPVMASDPTGLLATWREIVQMMNDFATSDGNDSMTFTSNGGGGGGGSAWSFGVSYSDGSGNIFDGVTISGNGFIANSTIGTGMWQTNQTVNVHLPEINVRGLSTREGGLAIQNHVYKNSPYYNNSTAQSNGDNVMASAGSFALTAAAIDGPLPIGDIIGAIVLAGATAYDSKYRTFVTYTMTNSTGKKYAGRTSGYGDPYSIMMSRYGSHHMKPFGYGAPVLDMASQGYQAYPAIRGREQQLIDFYGGVGHPNVGNSIRGVAYFNPGGRGFNSVSDLYFGPLAAYSGF